MKRFALLIAFLLICHKTETGEKATWAIVETQEACSAIARLLNIQAASEGGKLVFVCKDQGL